ncbi:undecaprenyl-phosphate galactose phosphotransferase [Dorea longicatena]|uniref:Undecaprenyl-phosphate galactose phosphotransferase n=1 Tax=Dorea longicatena TaxID=88431 RepID=A0A174N6Z3_9FIRM|nr:sugar transferase [Dorea longicatena]CUP42120.1 undecaprenyl-phosphate galactose phosphotransferase [Dorea longicatena]
MSIIGTRPPLISETNLYELHHRARLAIKPGITGMWQVSGRSDITDFEEVVRLDKEYITNWNIGLDINKIRRYDIDLLKFIAWSSWKKRISWQMWRK